MIPWIPQQDISTPFPDVATALSEPDGLLAAGGNLHPTRLLLAYRHGIFPWFSEGEPILWWSPSKRCILFSKSIHISKSMSRILKKEVFSFTQNNAFKEVIESCSRPRPGQPNTWITQDMVDAYCKMHQLGYAHSYECWSQEKLVGGIYGIRMGKIFFGESMFGFQSNASKAVLIHTAQQSNTKLIDCQIHSNHLESMGAEMIERNKFLKLLEQYIE